MMDIPKVQFCPQCMMEKQILRAAQLNLKYLYLDCGHILLFDERGYVGVKSSISSVRE